MLNLMERVVAYTIVGEPDECWSWSASTLPNGRPRLGLRSHGNISVTVARVIVSQREGLPLSDGTRAWVARHSCDNFSCVNPAHILAGTYQENTADMWDRGRGARGDRRSNSILSEDLVRSIRLRLAAGESQSSIGRDLGIQQSHISQVHRRKIWAWVE